jgi:hypothetical protein
MKIPVFVSMPNALNDEQKESLKIVYSELDNAGLEARTVGQTDYPTEFPLREVFTLARHCSGGVVLGFEQFKATAGVWKSGTPYEQKCRRGEATRFATPWNQLEAGILFALGLPLIVFKEVHIVGGVFDKGVTDLFIHTMPKTNQEKRDKTSLRQVFGKWSAQVQNQYYRGQTYRLS